MNVIINLLLLGSLLVVGGCGFFDPPVYNPDDPFGPHGRFDPIPPVYKGATP